MSSLKFNLKIVCKIVRKVTRFITDIFNIPYNFLYLNFNGVRYGKNFTINGHPYIINDGNIFVGNNVTVNSGKHLNPIGGSSECVLHTFKNGKIQIGDNVGLSNCAIISMSEIRIGDNCKIGGSVKIYDTDFHAIDYLKRRDFKTDIPCSKKISIGDDVFIGAGSTILKGVTIGNNSIIGAGSVVSKNIPSNQIWGGNPIKFIKELE